MSESSKSQYQVTLGLGRESGKPHTMVLDVRTNRLGVLTYNLSSAVGGISLSMSNIHGSVAPALPMQAMQGETADALAIRISKIVERDTHQKVVRVLVAVRNTPEAPDEGFSTGDVARACEAAGLTHRQKALVVGNLSITKNEKAAAAL